MIKTLSPYSTTEKTAEIMSRYRPIAPKPEGALNPMDENPSMSQKIKQSPYLRNLWPKMQARPTRTRKRGRAALSPSAIKRPRTQALPLSSPTQAASSGKQLSLQGFAHGFSQLPVSSLVGATNGLENPIAAPSVLVTLPLLPCSPQVSVVANHGHVPEINFLEPNREKVIDLNTTAEVSEESDFLGEPQQEAPTINVIVPEPVRPVGSSICVGYISQDASSSPPLQVPKKPEDVEEEVEHESFPTVISDSNNKVRMANSAYKELVGQPECSWLDCMVSGGGPCRGSWCKRICGEVSLQLSDSRVPTSSNGFTCWVRIEWGSAGKKNSVNTFCDVSRLSCESKDYLFIWRFHTQKRVGSKSSTNNA